MKFIKYKYIVTSLILLSICGCSQEEFINGGSSLTDGVKISLNIEGSSNSLKSVLDGTETSVDNESTISNLYLLFYEEGTAIRDKVKCLIAQPSLNNYGEWTGTLTLPGIVNGQGYNVYAFANVPQATVSKLSAADVQRGVIIGLVEELSARQDSSGRSISFSAIADYKGGQLDILEIKVKRTVAKLQVGIDMKGLGNDWSLQSVQVVDEMQKTSYVGTNPITPRITNHNAFKVTDADSVYYYLYENATSATDAGKVKLKINVTNPISNTSRSYTAIVNKKGNGQIIRNKIYKSKILLIEGSEPIELALDTVAWDNKYINVDIPNVYLDLPSNIVELSSTGYGHLNFKSNAKEIKVNWKDNNGLLVNSFKGPSTFITPKDELGNYQINFSMFSVEQGETKDTITLNVGNISKEVVVIKPLSDNFLALSVEPMESTPDRIYIYDRDPINDVGITITLRTTNFVKPWYLMSVLGIRKPDGSLDTTQGLPLDRGYLPGGSFTFNMMESFKKGGYSRVGIYECALRIGYSDQIGDYPHFRVHNFIIEIQN